MADIPPQLADSLRDRYERELGRGGMATVYLARDLEHKRSVGPILDPTGVLNRNPVPITPSLTSTGPAIGQVNIRFEPGAIVQPPGEDGEQLANRVARTLRDRARRRPPADD